MSQRPEDLATGYVRAAGLLALLIGIVVMHVFIAAHASAEPSEHLAAQTVTNSSAPAAPAVDHPAMPMPDQTVGVAPATTARSSAYLHQRHTIVVPTASTAADTTPGNPHTEITTTTAAHLNTVRHQQRSAIRAPSALPAPGSMAHPSAPGAITAQLTPALHQHGVASATTTLHSMIGPATATVHHATSARTSMPGGRMDPGCADGCCAMCGEMHACVFILTALVLILGLALLGRVGSDADAAARLGRGWAIRHARPPPWTIPSLSELSILRI